MRFIKLTGPINPAYINIESITLIEAVSAPLAAEFKRKFEDGEIYYDYSDMPTVLRVDGASCFVRESPAEILQIINDYFGATNIPL